MKTIVAALLIAVGAPAYAESFGHLLDDFNTARTQGKSTTTVVIDNDTLLLQKRDGFYTSGMQIGQGYTLRESTQSTRFGWRFGQELYTASDIKLPPERFGPPDHPYAGWLYGGFSRETLRDDGSHTKLGFDLGCLGPCAGGYATQTGLHHLIHQPLPQGWSKQVRNELGVVLYADVAPVRWTLHRAFDITPSVQGRFGNIYTDLGAGVLMRAGQLDVQTDQSRLHGFLRMDAHAVGYNATLQGGYFSSDNPHTVKPKRGVGEAELGLVWSQGAYGISASVVRRSNEIRELSNAKGAQSFARLLFSYTPT